MKPTFPLTQLIIDRYVRHLTVDQIRTNWRQGIYAGVSVTHIKGYLA